MVDPAQIRLGCLLITDFLSMQIAPLPRRIKQETLEPRLRMPRRSLLTWGVSSLFLFVVYIFLPFAYHDPAISGVAGALSARFIRGWGVVTHLTVRDDTDTPPQATSSSPGTSSTSTPPIIVEPPRPTHPPVHIPCGTRLSSDTTLEADMQCAGTALIVTGGITLDCDSYRIRGTGKAEIGILVNNVSGAVLRNCAVEQFLEGIVVHGGSDTTISDSKMEKNGDAQTHAGQGMRIDGGAERITIIGNTFRENYGDGLQVSDAPKGLFRGNAFVKNASENILILNSKDQTWEENTSAEAGENALYIKNVQESRFAGGIYAGRVTLANNTSGNIFSQETIEDARLVVTDSTKNTFINITVSGAGGNTCLQFKNSSDNVVKDGALTECVPDSVSTDGVSASGGASNMLIRVEMPRGGRIAERNGAHIMVE